MNTNENKDNWTQEQWDLAKTEAKELDKKNYDENHKPKVEKLHQAKLIIKELFGERSNAYKYINNKVSLPSFARLFDTLEWQYNIWKKKQEEKAKETKKKETEAIQNAYLERCIKYAQDAGKVLGVDFTLADVKEVAEEIHWDKLVKEYQDGGGYMEFSGDDNCENCSGWDMESHRCDCGNRRVSWSSWGFSLDTDYLSAEAN